MELILLAFVFIVLFGTVAWLCNREEITPNNTLTDIKFCGDVASKVIVEAIRIPSEAFKDAKKKINY